MNYNNSTPRPGKLRFVLLLLTCLLVLGGIIYMKRRTSAVRHAVREADSIAESPVVCPDTTLAPSDFPVTSDTVITAMPADTILGSDKRLPYEAGYEDGYTIGCDDGAAQTEYASFDDSNNFRRAADRDNYARGYREGYEEGYQDGLAGKQFNIKSDK